MDSAGKVITWSEYVRWVKDSVKQAEISDKTDVNQATISRWLNGGHPGKAEQVAAFARAFPTVTNCWQAFLAAGFVTVDDLLHCGVPSEAIQDFLRLGLLT